MLWELWIVISVACINIVVFTRLVNFAILDSSVMYSLYMTLLGSISSMTNLILLFHLVDHLQVLGIMVYVMSMATQGLAGLFCLSFAAKNDDIFAGWFNNRREAENIWMKAFRYAGLFFMGSICALPMITHDWKVPTPLLGARQDKTFPELRTRSRNINIVNVSM